MDNYKKILHSSVTSNGIFFCLVGVIFCYFVIRLIFFAIKIPHYIPPDEVTHFAFCKIFSQTWTFPVNSEKTYRLGNLIHIPWLYYYLMGKLLPLNVFPLSDLLFLRFINVLLSCGTILFSFRWIALWTTKRITQLFFLVVITNIPMLTFLGAAVSYDNLVNLCAVLSLYYMHRYFFKGRPVYFFGAGITLLVGCLTKISSLPLVPIYLGIFVIHEKISLKGMFDYFYDFWQRTNLSEKGLAGIFLVLLALCFQLYGTNLLQFNRLVPGVSQVMSEEQFMQHRISARNYIISKFRSGEWSYQKAVAEARGIKHPGDQRTALHVLKLQVVSRQNERPLMSRLKYSYNWFNNILANFVGINAHRPMSKTANELAIYQFIFLLSFFTLARYWKYEEAGFVINQSLALVLCYCLYLMLFHNYAIYRWSLSPTLCIQGRYIFPILVPFLGLVAYYFTNFFRQGFIYILVLLVSVFFIWGDFPYFQAHADSAWYNVLNEAVYHQQCADSYRKTGDLQKAVREYREAVRLAPENAWYHRFLADLYFETGEKRMALDHYLTAVRLQPQIEGFHYLAGKTYQRLGEIDEAVKQYQEAILINPDNIWYHRFLADLYRDNSMLKKAAQQYRKALQSESEDIYCREQLTEITRISQK